MKANQFVYEESGSMDAREAIASIIMLTMGLAITTVMIVFTSVLGGQTYQLQQANILAITNDTIRGYVNESIAGGFEAQAQFSGYLPIVALAVIITLVLSLIMSAFGGAFMSGGSRYNGYGGYGGGYGGIL